MKPENVERLLRSLPRERASDFLTPRVLAEVRAASPRRTLALRAAVLAGCVTLALAVVVGFAARRDVLREEERLASVRAEQARLERELTEIKQNAARAEPVVYVGSSDHYDYFIDLRELEQSPPLAQPAAYRPPQPGL